MTDDALHRFATKVVELQEKRTERVDEELLKSVALELGMSEADLLKAREESHNHKERARALQSSGALDDAINELDTAHAFNPLDIDATYLLADALFARSRKTKDAAEWQRAKALALDVLQAAPAHKDAATLLSAININEPGKNEGSNTPVIVFAIVAGVALLGIVAALLSFLG